MTKEQGFGAVTTKQRAEMAAIAVAAAARAEVEAGYILAAQHPRDEENSRVKILNVCKNLKFSETAIYRKPVGKIKKGNDWVQNYVEGLSIRFAEEAIRLWKNIKTIQKTIYDDNMQRIVNVLVIDLETNASYSKEIIIEKTVERKNATGRDVIGERINSSGERVFIVIATEDEIMIKEAALASKTIRNNALRLIPDYIITEAMETIRSTVKSGIDKDPEAAKRSMVDSFASIRVLPGQIADYLGHPVDDMTSDEIITMKELFNTIKEGSITWAEAVEIKNEVPKTAEVVKEGITGGGFVPPPRKAGENEWEYGDRCDLAKKEFENQTFRAGDPSTHTAVNKPVK